MPESDTIERNGHLNGYRHGPGSNSVFKYVVEPTAAGQVPLPQSEPLATATIQSRVKATEPDQPAREKTEGKATQSRNKAAESTRHTSGSSNAKAANKSEAPRVRYVPQRDLDDALQKLEALSCAAEKGDLAALDELRSELDSCPHIWQPIVDLQRMIEHKLITLIAGTDPLRAESFRKRNSELRCELSGQSGSVLVQLASSRVAAAWMFAQVLEYLVLDSLDEPRVVKKLADAERRLQIAVRTLATVKKLELQLQMATT
jgi:hypothetical protein